jgi:hypothetical protein
VVTNDRTGRSELGKWLTEEKTKRKLKDVDVSWLKDYVEKPAEEKK